MNIWLVTIGEPLPIDDGSPRLLRHGVLAEVLARRGHKVVWWTSSFDHARKQQRVTRSSTVPILPGLTLRILRAPGYHKNRSLVRFIDHFLLAQRFAREARRTDPPDVILVSYPPAELCWEAVRYGRLRNVPVVLDVRDAWPDIFLDMVPTWARWPVRLLLHPYYLMARWSRAGATAIVGITPEFVNWATAGVGRQPGPLDRAFPLACSDQALSFEEQAKAREFWDSFGIRKNDGVFTACFFGTMAPYFEMEVIFAAARCLQKKGSRIRFVICGDGDEFGRYQQEAKEYDNIVLPGWVGQAEIRELMRRSHVGLAPYRSVWHFRISIPNKIIEYLSAGLPIISSLEGSVATLLVDADCGLTYANGDSVGLVDALQVLESGEKRRTHLAANALKHYEENFQPETVYGAMADHLNLVARCESIDKHTVAVDDAQT